MDFPDDPNVAGIPDEYMFGPAFLVAPVTEQGATSRKVYLPAGCDWYNYWTNERIKGGQTIVVAAPVIRFRSLCEPVPLCPWGLRSSAQVRRRPLLLSACTRARILDFTLFTDDGTTYAYEKSGGSITKLHWDEASRQLKHEGAAAWSGPDSAIVDVVH